MLMDIIDQQTAQIRQYTEQISQQADLFARLARRFSDVQQQPIDQSSSHSNE